MSHLGARPWDLPSLTRESVIERQFGGLQSPAGRHPMAACPSAEGAVASLNSNMARWAEHYESVSDEDPNRPLGACAGQYGHEPYYALLLHLVDEYIHHAAEIAVMRDLYRAAPPPGPGRA